MAMVECIRRKGNMMNQVEERVAESYSSFIMNLLRRTKFQEYVPSDIRTPLTRISKTL